MSARPTAAILLTGNELLRGVISDANASHLARSLEGHGFTVTRTLIVGDELEDIEAGLRDLLQGSDLVVTSGGLGPTHDDRTIQAVATVAGVDLVLDGDVLERITRWTDTMSERHGFDRARFTDGNRKQAHIPAGADVLGIAGTAPGVVVAVGDAQVVVLPGVPSELRRLWAMAPDHPRLAGLFARTVRRSRRLIRTYGIGESHVATLFDSLGGDPPGVETGICARNFEIEIDIRADQAATANGDRLADELTGLLGEHVFAGDERPVAAIVLDLLAARGWTLAAAESCTGGLVARMLTDIPGSSRSFVGGVVAYADEVKTALLDVPAAVLAASGAVSPETAAAMADGARRRLAADVGVAVTGIAGPGGESPGKPVGLVHIHLESPAGRVAERFEFTGDRAGIRARAATAVLHMTRAHLATPS